jgi:hypothetical protein
MDHPIPFHTSAYYLGKEHSAEIAEEIDSLRSLDKSLAHAR